MSRFLSLPLGFMILLFLTRCSSEKTVELSTLNIETAAGLSTYTLENELFSGKAVEYQAEGVLSSSRSIVNGKLNGEFIQYFPDGTIESSTNYKENIVHGLYQLFYPDGTLRESVDYQNGKFEGKRTVYWTNGITKETNYFQGGILRGESVFYFSNGLIRKKIKYDSRGRKDGSWEDYYPNGVLSGKTVYKNGTIVSPMERFDRQGNPIN